MVTKVLKLFASKAFLPEGKMHAIILYPFWGSPKESITDPSYSRFQEYLEVGANFFKISDSPSDVDVFLLPFEYSTEKECLIVANKLIALAKSYKKKVIVFFNSDSEEEVELDNIILFRTSFKKSLQKGFEFALPAWSFDFSKYALPNLSEGIKKKKPSISYCGYIDFDENITLKERFFWWRKYNIPFLSSYRENELGTKIRGKAVRILSKDKNIETNFLRRSGFWAPGIDMQVARQQYVANMLSSDYALIARGAGNFSYRFYEALSCSRIPVFINTECVLPFDHIINWKDFCVWVEEREISKIGDILISFHKKITDEEFMHLKMRIRGLYEDWLSPSGFFSKMYMCLD
jgi:hypothetical protein